MQRNEKITGNSSRKLFNVFKKKMYIQMSVQTLKCDKD